MVMRIEPLPLLPSEDTGRTWPSMSLKIGSHQTLHLLVPSSTTQPLELWK